MALADLDAMEKRWRAVERKKSFEEEDLILDRLTFAQPGDSVLLELSAPIDQSSVLTREKICRQSALDHYRAEVAEYRSGKLRHLFFNHPLCKSEKCLFYAEPSLCA